VNDRPRSSIAGSPLLIGAITTLVVVVAVFLAWNANHGLPFVPTYDLYANLPNAENLIAGNDVRIGGNRVGAVDTITAVRRSDGTTYVRLHMKLQKSLDPLPLGSDLVVRSQSALGLMYLQITPAGTGGYKPDATIPLSRAQPTPVALDTVVNTFNAPTRDGQDYLLRGLGNGLAGRGYDLNRTIHVAPRLLGDLDRVMRNLAGPQTRLRRLFPALERTALILRPVAQTQGELFANLDTTFTALAAVAQPDIEDTIARTPPAEQAGIRGFPEQRAFLANSTGLVHELRPGVAQLPATLPQLADALELGTPALRRSPALSRRLERLFVTLADFSTDPGVRLGVDRLRDTAHTLNPTLAFLTPVQTTCNYLTLWFRNIASLLSQGDKNGTWQRFIIVNTPQGPNSESGPSSAPANGPTPDNFLHTNPYPNTASPGQTKECEAGNEDYLVGKQVIGNVPGNQGTTTSGQATTTGSGG
jgi:ABC-type transporter Mla subunit MlaD